MAWHVLTAFWLRHDLLFTRFPELAGWRAWNIRHFPQFDLDDWSFTRLWAWVNVHG